MNDSDNYEIKWEYIGGGANSNTERLKVPNGWLVRTTFCQGYDGGGVHMLVLEDKDHEWKLIKKEV